MTAGPAVQPPGAGKGWLYSAPSKALVAVVTLVALASVGGLAVVVAPLTLGPLSLFASRALHPASVAGWWLLGAALAAEAAWVLSFAMDDAGASPLRWLLPVAAVVGFTVAVLVIARGRRATPT